MMMAADEQLLARWMGKIDGSGTSPLEFYDLLKESICDSEIPNISVTYITRREGGWLSAKRVYLRVRYRKLFFDIGAFVAGHNLVVGWWLHKDMPGLADLLAEIPGLGFLLDRTLRTATYYSVDVMEHFQVVVHQAVLRLMKSIEDQNCPSFPGEFSTGSSFG